MKLELLSQIDARRAERGASRIERIDYVLKRDADKPEVVAKLKKERHRRSLELEILDLRSEELAEAGAEPAKRSATGPMLTTAA